MKRMASALLASIPLELQMLSGDVILVRIWWPPHAYLLTDVSMGEEWLIAVSMSEEWLAYG